MEISKNIDTLNKLQAEILKGHKLNATEMVDWNSNVLAVMSSGYTLKKKRIRNVFGKLVKVNWYVSTKKKHNFSAPFVKINVRPKDGKTYCKGDCTTRAMTYALKGAASYREIEKEQYKKAEEKNAKLGYKWGDHKNKFHRNTDGIWDKVIIEFGYIWIKLPKKIRRDKLASLLSSIKNPIISESSDHVAIIENGKVIDSWDSRGGFCKRILVNENDLQNVKKII